MYTEGLSSNKDITLFLLEHNRVLTDNIVVTSDNLVKACNIYSLSADEMLIYEDNRQHEPGRYISIVNFPTHVDTSCRLSVDGAIDSQHCILSEAANGDR